MDSLAEYRLMNDLLNFAIQKATISKFAFVHIVDGKYIFLTFKTLKALHRQCGKKKWNDFYAAIHPSSSGDIGFTIRGENAHARGTVLNNYAVIEHAENDYWGKRFEATPIDWALLKREKDAIMGLLAEKAKAS